MCLGVGHECEKQNLRYQRTQGKLAAGFLPTDEKLLEELIVILMAIQRRPCQRALNQKNLS